MALTFLGIPGPCSWPVVRNACHAVSGAAKAVANDVVGTVAHAMATAAQHMIALVMSFWTKVSIPGFDNNSGPVGELRHATAWVAAAIAVGCFLWAAGRLALTRNSMAAGDLVRGLVVLILVTALAVPIVNLLGSFLDGFSTWIINRSADTGTRLGGIGAGMAALDPGLVIFLAPLAILSSIVQIMLMVVRVAIVAILTGCLPMLAAASSTQAGNQSFRRASGWLVAALLYGPTAAIIYATAIWLVNTGQDVISIISGLMLIVLAVLALPALLRLVQPMTSPAVHAGGGGAAAGGGAMLATGARLAASKSESSGGAPSPARAPSGAATSVSASAGANGAAGAAGASSGGAAAGGAAAGAAAAAGGPVGVAVMAGLQVAQAAKGAADKAAGNGGNPAHKGES